MMKFLAAALLIALAPAAHGQTCAAVQALLSEAPVGFVERRLAEISPGTYAATLPGYEICLVAMNVDSQFACYGPPSEETTARQLYGKTLNDIRACLPGWRTAPYLDVKGPGAIVDGLRFMRAGAGGETIAGVGLLKLLAGEYRLSFGVIWKPTPRTGS